MEFVFFFVYLQLSELEQRVIEAEERAEEAEDKVRVLVLYFCFHQIFISKVSNQILVKK